MLEGVSVSKLQKRYTERSNEDNRTAHKTLCSALYEKASVTDGKATVRREKRLKLCTGHSEERDSPIAQMGYTEEMSQKNPHLFQFGSTFHHG